MGEAGSEPAPRRCYGRVLPARRRLGGQHYPGEDRGRAASGRRPVPHSDTHGSNGIRPLWEVATVAPIVRWHRTRRGVALSADRGGGPSASPDGPRMSKEEAVTDPIRVVVWSTGGVGSVAVDGIRHRPDLKLVGVW